MKNYSTLKKQLLKDDEVRQEYDALEPEFAIAAVVIKKRLEKGLTQSQLAKKVGTKQSAISRLESGNYNPSITFLERIAKALDTHLVISFS